MMTDCDDCATATLIQGELFNKQQKKYQKTNNTGCLENINYYKLINEPLREGFAVMSSSLAPSMASSAFAPSKEMSSNYYANLIAPNLVAPGLVGSLSKPATIFSSATAKAFATSPLAYSSKPATTTTTTATTATTTATTTPTSAMVPTSAKAVATSLAYSSKPATAIDIPTSYLGSDVAQSYLAQLKTLDTQFNSLVEQYNTAQASFNSTTSTYISNDQMKSPYLGTNITLNNNKSYYITKKGVAKMFDSSTTLKNTMGNNGCPAEPKSINASTLPRQISTGTAMISKQSCGNEGQNVYVSNIVENPTASYIGCYKDSTASPAMTPVNNNARIYNYETCMQSALDSGSTLFGLQNTNSTTGLSKCMVSTNLSTAKKYGVATSNCPTGKDNNIYGATNINAVYKTPDTIYVDTFVDKPETIFRFTKFQPQYSKSTMFY